MNPQHYDLITNYLKKFYGVTLFERAGVKHPVHVFYPEAEQIDEMDSIMGYLLDKTASNFPIYDYGFLHSLQNSGRHLYNGKTFSLHHIQPSPLKIVGQYGSYFDMLATSGALENELKDSAEERLIRLPLRSQFHRTVNVSQSVWNGVGRSATIGGACLVVFNDAGVYKAILARRSARNATDPNFYHVLPAFIFQPTRPEPYELEWKISHHIYREYLEELFGVPETSDAPPDWIYHHPALVDLQSMMANGLASLHVTGICMNLLTLRPEISALLLIRDAGWWQRIHDGNNTFHIDTAAEAQDGNIACVPIASDEALLSDLPRYLYASMPPQGFVALWLGVDLARKRLAE